VESGAAAAVWWGGKPLHNLTNTTGELQHEAAARNEWTIKNFANAEQHHRIMRRSDLLLDPKP